MESEGGRKNRSPQRFIVTLMMNVKWKAHACLVGVVVSCSERMQIGACACVHMKLWTTYIVEWGILLGSALLVSIIGF